MCVIPTTDPASLLLSVLTCFSGAAMSLTYHALEEGLSLPSDPAASHLLILGNKADIAAKAGDAGEWQQW